MVTRRRVSTLFRNDCVTLDIAASSTLTWRIPHQIPSTGELDIEPSQKRSAIALGDVQAERVAVWLAIRLNWRNIPISLIDPGSANSQ
jgi:hypothetical protein